MFYEQITKWQHRLPESSWASYSAADVERVLARETLRPQDLVVLLSPAALAYLEPMAKKAQAITLRNFGHTIGLFTPLYLANFCTNQCVYCSFHAGNEITRCKLTIDEVIKEGEAISSTGLQQMLQAGGRDGFAFLNDFIYSQLAACNFIASMETTIDALVCAKISEIQRRKQPDRVAKIAEGYSLSLFGHRF